MTSQGPLKVDFTDQGFCVTVIYRHLQAKMDAKMTTAEGESRVGQPLALTWMESLEGFGVLQITASHCIELKRRTDYFSPPNDPKGYVHPHPASPAV